MQPIFARITKVDEERREVSGRAAQEVIDRDNELFDYATSKPNFQQWSAEVFADSGGKSMGNVRSMHGNTAAGKVTDIQFDDVERAIDITAKIVDDNEWKKVLEGVHTGFSIGGRYARKWAEPINGKIIQRYTAVPSEISIVDRPCIPTAKFFSIHKRDGSVEERPFVTNYDRVLKSVSLQFFDKLTKYSEDQARDDHGRFASDAAAEATAKATTASSKAVGVNARDDNHHKVNLNAYLAHQSAKELHLTAANANPKMSAYHQSMAATHAAAQHSHDQEMERGSDY